MKAALLPDRGVVKVAGEDAATFLNGLVTTDVDQLAPGQAAFGALLTPQGKIIVDFMITEAAAPMAAASSSIARARWRRPGAPAQFYKLRAKVADRGPLRRSRRAGGLGRRADRRAGWPMPIRGSRAGLRCMLLPDLR